MTVLVLVVLVNVVNDAGRQRNTHGGHNFCCTAISHSTIDYIVDTVSVHTDTQRLDIDQRPHEATPIQTYLFIAQWDGQYS